MKKSDKFRIDGDNYICLECGKQYSKQGIHTHIWRTHGAGRDHKPTHGIIGWNRGLTKGTDERVRRIAEKLTTRKVTPGNCETCGTYHDGTYGSGRFCQQRRSRSFATRDKREEINRKVSEKFKKLDPGQK